MMKPLSFALLCGAVAMALSPAATHALSWADVAAYWSFDEATGTHFYDASGNGNHATFGTFTNPQLTAGECALLDASYAARPGAATGTGAGLQFGWECQLNDTLVTPLVDVPEAVMPTLADNFAVSMWLDAGVWASEYGVLASYNDDTGATGREWVVGIDTNKLVVGSANTGKIAFSTPISGLTGGYHHFVAQFTGEDVTALYVDGVSVANAGGNPWFYPSSKGFVLGARERAKVGFPVTGAWMDDFALLDASLTQADVDAIAGNYAAGNDLGALAGAGGILEGKLNTYFKLNETTGSTVLDASGNGHNGELRQWSLGAPKDVSEATVAGRFGGGAEFGGSTVEEACQVIPSVLPAVGSEAFTTTFWLKLADWSAGGQVISWDDENQTEFGIVVGSGGTNAGRLYVYANSVTDGLVKNWVVLDEAAGGENLANGELAHFAVVVDAASNVSVYVNGELKELDGVGTAYNPTSLNTTFIGGRAANGLASIDVELPGVLDDLAVFKGALTAAEIGQIMARGVAAAVPEPGTFVMLLGVLAVWGLRRAR